MKSLTIHEMLADGLSERCAREFMGNLERDPLVVFSDERSEVKIFFKAGPDGVDKSGPDVEIDIEEFSFGIIIGRRTYDSRIHCDYNSRIHCDYNSTSIDFDPEKMMNMIISIIHHSNLHIRHMDNFKINISKCSGLGL